ncbi:MAG: SH3 domain-containing protein [Chloroflexota bacterium]
MKPSRITFAFTFLLAISLTACGSQATPTDPPPATATSAGFLTDPDQATAEATARPPTLTQTRRPSPPAAALPLPSATPTPAPSPTATPAPEPAVTVKEELTTKINVRSGPGTAYPVVAQFEPGQAAVVTGRTADQSWWQIELGTATGAGETPGWVYGQLVTLAGDEAAIPVAEIPPTPVPPTPDPAAAQAETEADQAEDEADPTAAGLEEQLRCSQDFCVTYQAMVPIWENGGCIGNHSIYVTVLEGPPPGRPMDGVVIGDTFNNIEVASGDKGPGFAEVTLWMNTMSLKVKRHIDGTPYTSEESFPFTSHDELIPAEVLAANGYCDGSVEECRRRQNQNQVCRGHYSYKVTFHKFD